MLEKREEDAELDRRERVERFIHALAVYLVSDQAVMSIKLQMGKPEAVAWQKLRSCSPLFGYLSVDEAKAKLAEFFGVRL